MMVKSNAIDFFFQTVLAFSEIAANKPSQFCHKFKKKTYAFITEFYCKNDLDCYNKGKCNDGVCLCQPGWQEQADCTGI